MEQWRLQRSAYATCPAKDAAPATALMGFISSAAAAAAAAAGHGWRRRRRQPPLHAARARLYRPAAAPISHGWPSYGLLLRLTASSRPSPCACALQANRPTSSRTAHTTTSERPTRYGCRAAHADSSRYEQAAARAPLRPHPSSERPQHRAAAWGGHRRHHRRPQRRPQRHPVEPQRARSPELSLGGHRHHHRRPQRRHQRQPVETVGR